MNTSFYRLLFSIFIISTNIQINYLKETTISLRVPAHGAEWHYGEKWPEHFKDCGESHQSPIRLESSTCVTNRSLHLKLGNYNKVIRRAFIENNGHTVQIGFSDKIRAFLNGSATDYQKFKFEQMHFHWGSYNGVGAEHTVNGYRGPLEMHLVHYNSKYGDFDDAIDKDDGLMVLGIIFRITSKNNQFLSTVINLVRDVPKYKDKSWIKQSFTLRSLLPNRMRPFFMYMGSLTTPPCYESVRWLVFRNTVPIGNIQEKQFRKVRSGYVNGKNGRKKTVSNNYRPMQKIGDRQIFISP